MSNEQQLTPPPTDTGALTLEDVGDATFAGGWKNMEGPERAATVMLVLGEEFGAPIWRGLSDNEIRRISLAMSNLSSVSTDVLEELLTEFIARIRGSAAVVGSYESTVRLLSEVMPSDRVQQLMEEIRGPAGRTVWEKLSNVDHAALANFLQKEYPQTVAVVLSRIKPSQAANVLAELPENIALDVIQRMLNMDAVRGDILMEVERTINNEFLGQISRTRQRRTVELVADIFNNFDRETEGRVMNGVESVNPAASEQIRSLMFTFDDFINLSDNDLQLVIRNIDTSVLGIALKTAKPELSERFFGNMTARASNMLRQEMELSGPVKLKDVDQAQFQMVIKAKELSDGEQISLNKSADEDEFVE